LDLLFTEYHPETGVDIWVFDRGAGAVRPFIRTRFNEYAPVLSPDARYVAYTSDESGRPEIYLVEYPEAVGKRQLSTEGGVEPLWARDGSELFYRSGDRVMRVDMSRGAANAGVPTTVFEGRFVKGTVTCLSNYDARVDGRRFVMVVEDTPPAPSALFVTSGWFDELKNVT
jgi:serine/threonine-protein kinase